MGNCCNFTEIFTLWILGWTLHFTDAKMPLFSFTAVNLWAPRSPPNPRGDELSLFPPGSEMLLKIPCLLQ